MFFVGILFYSFVSVFFAAFYTVIMYVRARYTKFFFNILVFFIFF